MNTMKKSYKLQVTSYKCFALLFALSLFVTNILQAQTAIPTYTNLTPPNTTAMNYRKVCFRDSANGFILTDKGHLMRTKDGGKTWNLQQKLQDHYLTDMCFISKDTAVIVGYGNIFKSNDGGETWYITQVLPVKDGSVNQYRGFNYVSFINKTIGFAFGQELIWKTADGGKTWKEVFLGYDSFMGNIASIHFTDALHGLAFADTASFQTSNGGETWQKKYYPNDNQFTANYFFTSLHGYIGGFNGSISSIQETFDGGNTWNNKYQNSNDFYMDFFFFNNGKIGKSYNATNAFLSSADSGKTW